LCFVQFLTINTDYAPKHYLAVDPYNGDCLLSVWREINTYH